MKLLILFSVLFSLVIICKSACSKSCNGTCIVYTEDNFCACPSGYKGQDCITKIDPICDPSFGDVSPTTSGFPPVDVTSRFSSDSLEIRIYSPLVTDRKYSTVSGSVNSSSCSYPGTNWMKDFDTERCLDIFVGHYPWTETSTLCGWRQDFLSDPDFYLFNTELTLQHVDSLARALGNLPGTQNLKRVTKHVIPLIVQFRKSVDLSTSINYQYVYSEDLFNYVWIDVNMDGMKNNNEPGLPGVTVLLFKTSDPTTLVAQTTTDENGSFRFDILNIQPKTWYNLLIDLSSNSFLKANGYGVVDQVKTGGNNAQEIRTPINTLVAMSQIYVDDKLNIISGAKFGMANSTAQENPVENITNYVWLDENENGIKDLNENGMSGINIDILIEYSNGSFSHIYSETTDSDGKLNFLSRINFENNTLYHIRIYTNDYRASPIKMYGENIANQLYESNGLSFINAEHFNFISNGLSSIMSYPIRIGLIPSSNVEPTTPTLPDIPSSFSIDIQTRTIENQKRSILENRYSVLISTITPNPYYLEAPILIKAPYAKGTYSIIDSTDLSTCISNNNNCSQNFVLNINAEEGGCSVSGEFLLRANLACNPNAPNAGECPYKDISTDITIDVLSDNYCRSAGIAVDFSSELNSYDSPTYDNQAFSFLIGDVIYFKANLQPTTAVATITSVQIVDVKATSIALPGSSPIFLFQNGISVSPTLAFAKDVQDTASSDGFHFTISDPSFLNINLRNSEFLISSTVVVNFVDPLGLRSSRTLVVKGDIKIGPVLLENVNSTDAKLDVPTKSKPLDTTVIVLITVGVLVFVVAVVIVALRVRKHRLETAQTVELIGGSNESLFDIGQVASTTEVVQTAIATGPEEATE
eukprot:TRINITY_DN1565_c0_g1_i1.p2 TRINITY_DN1565_c0_g1~~TRINITY_DN1565_c0_g1_i1.p2  ORF type:complete len:869 (-),score=170.04 TRINITY_DN1565_c0_g1_i1:3566-6172(-)